MFPKINKPFKSLLILGLSFFLFACAFFDQDEIKTSSATFSLSATATRAAVSPSKDSETFIDVELKDSKSGYSAKQTMVLKAGSELICTFEEVPVGAEIIAYAQIYFLYENEKCILYEGKSLAQIIQKEDNLFRVQLSIAYNSVVETSKAYIVNRPLFKVEHDGRKLETNKLEFKYDDDITKCDETFTWDFDKLGEYQLARITFKGAKLKSDEPNTLAFKLSKTTTGAIYYKDQMPVVADSSVYDFDINQFIGLNAIGIENLWDPERNNWSGDFSCYIEKIELLKAPDAIPPDFNAVTTTTSSYIVRNPALQIGAYTNINENKITFDSRQAYFETGSEHSYSAAYWEFPKLSDYDKITITLRRAFSEDADNKLIIRGYTPYDFSIGQQSATSTIPDTPQNLPYYHILTDDNPQKIEIYLEELKTDLNIFTAISFQNNSFIEDPDHPGEFNYGNKWLLEIEEIKLEKLGAFDIQIDVPAEQDITVSPDPDSIPDGTRFTAPEGFISYVWKVNGVVQTEATGNVFDLLHSTLPYGRTDVSLLVNDGTNYYSWQSQVYKPVN